MSAAASLRHDAHQSFTTGTSGHRGTDVKSDADDCNSDNPDEFDEEDESLSLSSSPGGTLPEVNRLKMLGLLSLVGSVEGFDIVLFPCMLLALQRDLGLSMHGLAWLTTFMAIAWNIGNPIWAVTADRGIMRRKDIIVIGCTMQGVITVAMSQVSNFWAIAALRLLNGFALASLRPIANGILAQVVSDKNRGKAFGGMASAMQAGSLVGMFVATNYGRRQVFGYSGWRLTFAVMGAISTVIGLVIWRFMDEPPRPAAIKGARDLQQETFCATIRHELGMLYGCLAIPTFSVILLQGFFSGIAFSVWHYKALFYQLLGMPDVQVSVILMTSRLAAMAGHLGMGFVADVLSKRSPDYGRTALAQVTLLAGFPMLYAMFGVNAPIGHEFVYFLVLQVAWFLLCASNGCAVNKPVLAEIIRADRRATVMAWEATLEHGTSAIFGNAIVAFMAEEVYGYSFQGARVHAHHAHGGNVVGGHADLANAGALGNALLLTYVVPAVISLLLWTLLYKSYPRDRRRKEIALAAQAGQCGCGDDDASSDVE